MTTVVPGQSGESVLAGRPPRVLVVEDQPQLLRALRINLRARQYEVLTAAAGREALAAAAASPPDAVILDLGLPDIDGISVITAFRAWSRAPIIVLSGRTSPGDKIGALDAGADDYVTKPFEMAELLARLRAALRRDAAATAPSVAAVGRWTIDLAAHTVSPRTDADLPITNADFPVKNAADSTPGGSGVIVPPREPGDSVEPMRLTPTEWQILEILLRRPGQLVGSAQLLTGVWGPGFQDRTNYLRFHMARLRRKLEDDPARPRHLLTEPGMGYRYQP
jgi:two-component system KDP operon response regulator KdpE